MDPVTEAVQEFQQTFRDFKDNPELKVLRIVTQPNNAGTLAKILRGEEWAPDNQSPFLIFDRAFTTEGETFEAMSQSLIAHYKILQDGLKEQETILPDFNMESIPGETSEIFSSHVVRFIECIQGQLKPPYLCWFASDVRDDAGYERAIANIIRYLYNHDVRFVFSDDDVNPLLAYIMKNLPQTHISVPFKINEEKLQEHFKKLLLTPPSKGRAPGTLPGSAAPDVEPPPRPGPQPPTNEQVKKTLEEMGLPPVLTPEEAELLRLLVFEAAQALADGNQSIAINKQTAACQLCARASVKLEEAVMTMVLASYYLQFQREEEAEKYYYFADRFAGDAGAYAQMAQARMALGFLFMKQKRIEDAIHIYEQAAAAAVMGQVNLLYFESLRMAGSCHLQQKRVKEAYRCWRAAVAKAKNVSIDEIKVSSFMDIVSELIKLLKENGLVEHVKSIENLVVEIGEASVA
jgi:tetratricopeptide (TPR) repeat protein